jgi:hypothetical protein
MKPVITQIFVTLGAIFLILILIGVYFFVTDPYNLKPLIFGSGPTKSQFTNTNTPKPNTGSESSTTDTSAGAGTSGFQLSDAQKQALIDLGIDPASVPSTISAEQEACFVSVLGAARVAEIKAGAVPSTIELLRAKSCI